MHCPEAFIRFFGTLVHFLDQVVHYNSSGKMPGVETSLGNDFVRFKSSESSEPEKIAPEKIKGIAFLKEDKQTTAVECDYIKVYLGWGQKRISDYGWYQVVEKGIVTLYRIERYRSH